jgi:hypothetical protein
VIVLPELDDQSVIVGLGAIEDHENIGSENSTSSLEQVQAQRVI